MSSLRDLPSEGSSSSLGQLKATKRQACSWPGRELLAGKDVKERKVAEEHVMQMCVCFFGCRRFLV